MVLVAKKNSFILLLLFFVCNLGLWSSPSVKGSQPPPCSSFSLTVIDENQAVMFGGGSSVSIKSSKAYILHLPTMVSHFPAHVVNKISTKEEKIQKIALFL